MKRWLAFVGLMAMTAGCEDEHWYAFDDVSAPFEAPGPFGVRVTTTPEAWPKRLYGFAVRATFQVDGQEVDEMANEHDARRGELWLVDEEGRETTGGQDWVNVLDAWDGCDRDETCVRELWFEADCARQTCEGEVFVDAFFSTHWVKEPDRGGEIRLELLF